MFVLALFLVVASAAPSQDIHHLAYKSIRRAIALQKTRIDSFQQSMDGSAKFLSQAVQPSTSSLPRRFEAMDDHDRYEICTYQSPGGICKDLLYCEKVDESECYVGGPTCPFYKMSGCQKTCYTGSNCTTLQTGDVTVVDMSKCTNDSFFDETCRESVDHLFEEACGVTEAQGMSLYTGVCKNVMDYYSNPANQEAEFDEDFLKFMCGETKCLQAIADLATDSMKSDKCQTFLKSGVMTASEVEDAKEDAEGLSAIFGVMCATRSDGVMCLDLFMTMFEAGSSDDCPTCTAVSDLGKECCVINCMGCCLHTILDLFKVDDSASIQEAKEAIGICGGSDLPCPSKFDDTVRYVTVEVAVADTVEAEETKAIKAQVAAELGVNEDQVFVSVEGSTVIVNVLTDETSAGALQRKADSSTALSTSLAGHEVSSATVTVKKSSATRAITMPLVALLVGLLGLYL